MVRFDDPPAVHAHAAMVDIVQNLALLLEVVSKGISMTPEARETFDIHLARVQAKIQDAHPDS